ncbi:MAG: fibronectin type III domain-containing protein, partial [Patescibacteria group bacterium]
HRSSLRSVLYFATGFAIVSLAAGFSIVRVLAVTSGETPSNVALDQITVNSMRLSWRDNSSGETVFRIERSTDGANYSEVGTLSSATSNTTGASYTYTNSGMSSLSANAKYWYRVRACNGNPITYQSGKVYLATVNFGQCTGYGAASPKFTLANAPASCSGTADNSDPTRINWTWVSGGVQSGFYASDAAGNTGWVTRTYWNQTGLSCGTNYTLSVKARNGDLVQTSSVSCTASTKACAQQICGDNATKEIEGDYNDSICLENEGWMWNETDGNAGGSCWNGMCCGDDSNEYWIVPGTFTDCNGLTLSPTQPANACCSNSSDCVDADGSCISAGTYLSECRVCPSKGTSNHNIVTDCDCCSDGVDNDGDGKTDSADSDCGGIQSATCGDNSYNGTEYDYSQSSCQATFGSSSYGLTSGDASGSCWNGMCCGDDSSENYNYCYLETGPRNYLTVGPYCSSPTPQTACCNSVDDCVTKTNSCVNGNTEASGLNPGGVDNVAYCNAGTVSGGSWRDCDVIAQGFYICSSSTCGNSSGIYAGESGVGEYPDTSTLGCCGDDSSENYQISHLMNSDGATGGEKSACCNSSSDCVKNDGTCISNNTYSNHGGDASSDQELCTNKDWYDQDGSQSRCQYTWFDGTMNRCENAGPGGNCDDWDGYSDNWYVGAPYADPYYCCGDDANEKFVPDCSGNPNVVCCPSTANYWNGSSCVASCPTGDTTPPAVSVFGAPSKWQNTNSAASVACSDTGSGCSSSSYKLKAYTSAATCSKNYSDYMLSSPQTVTAHTFYCAAAKDNAGNIGFSSTAAEFKVDKTAPVVSQAVARCDSYTDICANDNDSTIYFTWSPFDSGDSGLVSCTAELNDTTPDESAGISGKDTDTGKKGSNAYYVQCKDAAGNVSSVISDGISIGVK